MNQSDSGDGTGQRETKGNFEVESSVTGSFRRGHEGEGRCTQYTGIRHEGLGNEYRDTTTILIVRVVINNL